MKSSIAQRGRVLAESLVSKNNNQWKQLNSDITKSFSLSEVCISQSTYQGPATMQSIFGFIVLLQFHYSFIYKMLCFLIKSQCNIIHTVMLKG